MMDSIRLLFQVFSNIKRHYAKYIFHAMLAYPNLLLAESLTIEKVTGDHSFLLSDGREILLHGVEILDGSSLPKQRIIAVEQEDAPDRYGRIPSRIFLSGKHELSKYLLEKGLARLHPRKGEPSLSKEWQEREKEARMQRRGIWKKLPYQEKPASDRRLWNYIGTYQLIAGTVSQVKRSGQGTEVELDGIVTARIAEKLEKQAYFVDFDSLLGRKVAIRGWLGNFRGLVVKIDRMDQIELEP